MRSQSDASRVWFFFFVLEPVSTSRNHFNGLPLGSTVRACDYRSDRPDSPRALRCSTKSGESERQNAKPERTLRPLSIASRLGRGRSERIQTLGAADASAIFSTSRDIT